MKKYVDLSSIAPCLSLVDLRETGEGYLDPLGLYAIADSLGVQLAPGVRERQSHPAYLVAMAVTAAVCSVFDEDEISVDGVTPPWQVFEWYVAEGLVRMQSEDKQLIGLPGRDKVTRALKDRVPISFLTYLKTASVFGFHGVYRLLAKTLDVVNHDRLGEVGYRLLAAWEEQRGMQGFYTHELGPGRSYRKLLQKAVEDGLKQGQVARGGQWSGWEFFHNYLHPRDITQTEANIIGQALLDDKEGHRSEVVSFLISKEGRLAWQDEEEQLFHQELVKVTSTALNALLDAISSYENFACRLQVAFEDCLYQLSQDRRPTSYDELAEIPIIKENCKHLPAIYRETSERLQPFSETIRFETSFSRFASSLSATEWVAALLEYHRSIQNNKPPNGRAPWLDWFEDGKVMVRAGYVRNEGGNHQPHYMHAYRTAPLFSFAHDLGMLDK